MRRIVPELVQRREVDGGAEAGAQGRRDGAAPQPARPVGEVRSSARATERRWCPDCWTRGLEELDGLK